MPASTLKADLERLQQEVDSLTKRASHEAASADSDSTLSPLREFAESVEWKELSEDAGELLKKLGRDVKDSKTSALVASFLAGVAVGRMLSK